MHAFEVAAVRKRLTEAGGGYEIVHESAGLEFGVYVLEIYVVLDGTGVLEVEGEQVSVSEGSAVFVEAGADHRFTAYEHLAVLVIFERRPTGNP